MNKKFWNYNSQRESITDLSVYFKNKKMNLPPISHLFLFCIFGTLFLLIEFDTKYHPSIINIVWADVINGTENADNITGTINKDIIKGLNGNDTISGMHSGDDISGGSGDDIIYGNEGRDVLKGKAGNDRIEGGEGNDRIIGDRGNDILIGGPGNDALTGGLGKDIFICGTGTDTITDFNLTQKDSTPENDCEIIKYDGNKEAPQTSSIQQQQSYNLGNVMDSKQEVSTSNNNSNDEKTVKEEEEKNPNRGFFFGLFK
jgi:hypothetical protein